MFHQVNKDWYLLTPNHVHRYRGALYTDWAEGLLALKLVYGLSHLGSMRESYSAPAGEVLGSDNLKANCLYSGNSLVVCKLYTVPKYMSSKALGLRKQLSCTQVMHNSQST
jgi:hypothetical protein